MTLLAPTAVRYIKLGPGGAWLRRCVDERIMELGYGEVPHDLASGGDRAAIDEIWLGEGRTPGKAKSFTREVLDFYRLGSDCLWITIGDGRVWWCFAEPEVHPIQDLGGASRYRNVIGSWSDRSLTREVLSLDRVSTRLTKVAAYQQTICAVQAKDYLLRRINGLEEPAVQRAISARSALTAGVVDLIQALDWRDFEVMTDLIFAGSGWRRVSGVGGSDQADTDLVFEQAVTGERAFAQIKSACDVATYRDYVGRLRANPSFQRMFFICHSPRGAFPAESGVHVWLGDTLADQAVKAGLVDWLIARAR